MSKLFAVALAFTATLSHADESVFPTKEEREMARMLEPQEMSVDVKNFLRSKMKSHNKFMKDLVIAVATLRWDECKKSAQSLANAPRLDTAAAPALDLPPAFFTLQDSMKKQATALVAACEAKKADDLLAVHTQLMGTCMSCHNAYLIPLREKGPAKK